MANQVKYCPRCGAQNHISATHCGKCGAPQPNIEAIQSPMLPRQKYAQIPKNIPAITDYASPVQETSVSSLWYVVALIFGIFGGGLGWFFNRKKNPEKAKKIFNVSARAMKTDGLDLGQFILIKRGKSTKDSEINWINNRIEANIHRGLRTIIVSYYDILTPNDIEGYEDTDLLYFLRVQIGSHAIQDLFESKFTTISDDINQLGLLLTDTTKASIESNLSYEIIIYSLSTMMHTHGWKRVYSLFIALFPLIKNSTITLTAFIHPESHNTTSEVSIFESMADTIIEL